MRKSGGAPWRSRRRLTVASHSLFHRSMILGKLSYASNAFYPSLGIGNIPPLTWRTNCPLLSPPLSAGSFFCHRGHSLDGSFNSSASRPWRTCLTAYTSSFSVVLCSTELAPSWVWVSVPDMATQNWIESFSSDTWCFVHMLCIEVS